MVGHDIKFNQSTFIDWNWGSDSKFPELYYDKSYLKKAGAYSSQNWVIINNQNVWCMNII